MGTDGITITIFCLILTNCYYIKVSAENYEKISPTFAYASVASAERGTPLNREDANAIPSSSYLYTSRTKLPVLQQLIQLFDFIHYNQEPQQKQDIGNLFKYLLINGDGAALGHDEKRSWQNLQGSWGKRNNDYNLPKQQKQPNSDDRNINENINGIILLN